MPYKKNSRPYSISVLPEPFRIGRPASMLAIDQIPTGRGSGLREICATAVLPTHSIKRSSRAYSCLLSLLPSPSYVHQEEVKPFSVAAGWKKFAAAALGAVNLGGALYLQQLLSGPAFAGVTLPGYYGFVQASLLLLLQLL